MDGEFVCEDTVGITTDAVGGGNLLILGRDRAGLLATTEAAVEAIAKVHDVITPFPGGIVRSGSKVGAKYKGMIASTNDAFCPTLKGATKTELSADTIAVLEIVIDGLTSKAVADAMRAGLKTRHRDRRRQGRDARLRRQLRRQARPASLSPEGSPAMSGFVLKLRQPPAMRLDLSGLIPSKLAGLSAADDRSARPQYGIRPGQGRRHVHGVGLRRRDAHDRGQLRPSRLHRRRPRPAARSSSKATPAPMPAPT